MENKEFSGKVVWFNPQLGYGFIARGEGIADIFVYYSDIAMNGYKIIMAGDLVTFGEETRNNRLVATNVKLVERKK